jgi:putative ABC transport system ATP-binding protein
LILDLIKISLTFDDKTLFNDVSLTINQGDFIIIRGASGSGKSSFLRLLNRLTEPSSGTISSDGSTVTNTEVTTYRRRVGYVQQTPILIPGTVVENLTLPYKYKSATTESPDRSRLEADMVSFNLDDVKLDDLADNLSVGQKQRIALIRTLLTEPDIILGDEPTSALDPESRSIVEDRLRKVNREQNTTVILVTHLDFDPGDVVVRHFTIDGGHLKEGSA